MKVLIADFDLFVTIGGGQTFYRSIIEKNPQINFYYLIKKESLKEKRPPNAYPILYREKYFTQKFNDFCDLGVPKWMIELFIKASNIAVSVAGESFDIVDLPDYEQFGTFLRPALEFYQVKFGKIALSLHGRISTTISLNWSTEGMVSFPCELTEKMQYCTVDLRYGLSKSYLDEWREIIDLESHYLNPLSFMNLPKPRLSLSPSNEPPDLNFVGRTEKRKGPDIFIQLASWLPRNIFNNVNIIGSQSFDQTGIGSSFYLFQMTNNHFEEIQILPAMSPKELMDLFYGKSVTFVPSKYDTFNFVALESLFSGCPTVIGNGAGVVRFLKEEFPEIPFVTLDIKNIYSSLSEIVYLLKNYQEYRQNLVNAILSSSWKIREGEDNLKKIYESPSVYQKKIRDDLERWYENLMSFYKGTRKSSIWYLQKSVRQLLKKSLSPVLKSNVSQLKELISNPKLFFRKNLLFLRKMSDDLQIAEQGVKVLSLVDRYQYLFNLGEETEKELVVKLQDCWNIASDIRVDRVRLWREIARIEQIRGNDLVSATYQLRSMRAIGYDKFGDLANVMAILDQQGFKREAIAAEAMYGLAVDREERCRDIIQQAFSQNRYNQNWDYEFVDDRRSASEYKASVIVSLYNAASKLPLFLQALQQQTLMKAGKVEVILVDSGSLEDEYSVFQHIMDSLNIPIIYARSAQRETIQSAWNRGISLSRAPYLAFLGVDETIYPESLEILANELDADASLDWVQGNSLVTNVDKNCLWLNDVMIYDRENYKQDFVYLETCYLSWVGALYRRSIHDRFGYYDASFKAAGDTEFKNRILPFIKSKSLPKTLGLFWNYPDERTTQHPRAEIEDLRAWYLHRTLAGVKYAFANRDPQEAEELLIHCLRYRKSYCRHWSTDFEYANHLATFLAKTLPNSPLLKYQGNIQQILSAYQRLDYLPKISPLSPVSQLMNCNKIAKKIQKQHHTIRGNSIDKIYRIFNDNRYEQHSFLWFTDL